MSERPNHETRHRSLCRRIAKLADEGFTSRQIAEIVEIDVKRVKSLRENGKRLLSLRENT